MELSEDLSTEVLGTVCGDRPVRTFPALVSTEAEALAWARTDAPGGAAVVADYQVAPRGLGGRVWESRPGEGLGFSLVLRPRRPVTDGWLFAAGTLAVAETLGPEPATIRWPDEVLIGDRTVAPVGVRCEPGWAVVSVLVGDAEPPRGELLNRLAHTLETRADDASEAVLGAYRARCRTLGREVIAKLLPLGPNGPKIEGRAVDVLVDGAMVIETDRGNRVAVRAEHLGALEDR